MQRLRSFLRLIALSRIAMLGAGITTLAFVVYVALTLGELFVFGGNPYWGIALNVIFPAIMVAGLILIAIGLFIKDRLLRNKLGDQSITEYAADKRINHRYVLQVVITLTILNTGIFGYFSYNGYLFMESREFCGELCHVVMEPELVVYKHSPHSEISCVVCHIGEGATWFVKSKLSGMRQVYGVLSGDYSRPIETPVKNLRPARDVCEVCHRPEIFHGNRIRVLERFASDRENSRMYTVLNLRVGSGGEKVAAHGIHWHVSRNHEIQYYASDEKREKIDWIAAIGKDGEQRTWTRPGSNLTREKIDETHIRTMDCVDCHNRPTHIYLAPDRALDEALALGRIDPTIPWIRSYGEEIITRKYETKELGLAGIAELSRIYQERDPQAWEEYQEQILGAITVLQEMYATYVYPRMNLQWNTYPSLIGHPVNETAGCFRCHDGLIVDDKGVSPATDCDGCHFVLAREEKDPVVLKVLSRE